ncbi:MAG: N-acetylmuramoyl-L-alanine amidase [Geobacter sp.]|nr:N-acetylmuramoyl-L-alanine amidase [Geobacter sp.]
MQHCIVRLIGGVCLALMLMTAQVRAEDEQPRIAKKQAVVKKKAQKGKAAAVKATKATKGARKKGAADSAKKPVVKPRTVAENPPADTRPMAVVREFRSWSNPDYTRIAVTLDHDARFEYHQLGQNRESGIPGRLYLDIGNAHLGPGVKDIPIGDGLLKTARIGQFRSDTVRVVLDMESIKDYKVFTFSDPYRIMIDVRGERRMEISSLRERIESAPSLPPSAKEPAVEKPLRPTVAKTAPAAIGKIRRVVVDPGHGGHDPGAIGAGGTREKDVVLAIGLKLAKRLKEELGLDVVMTRTTDVFLELQERTAIANQVGADLFISVHANAAPNRASAGIETYYLSLAKTEKAAQLAAKENGTSLEKVSLLQAVLFDLMVNYKINDSAHLAEVVQKELHHKVDARYPVKSLGVKQGPFYVLVGATMPSILVETAFLSNEKEEQRLRDAQYQEMTADGIMEGVRAYIASQHQQSAYVRQGDTGR